MTNTFRIAGLGGVSHTPETKQIFKLIPLDGTISHFLSTALIKFAESRGFNETRISEYQQDFISEERLIEINEFENKARRVDYTYLYAYEYLKRRLRYSNHSSIIRAALQFLSK